MGIIFGIIFLVNLVVIDVFLYFGQRKKGEDQACPVSCQAMINNLPTVTPMPSPQAVIPIVTTIIQQKVAAEKTRNVQYIPIPGSGSTLENKWVDLLGTEFYFSTNDYPNLVGAYFEANMKLMNGNGLAYLRLFDVTSGIEVWGSEISTNSQKFTSVSSGKLTIRNGTRLYRVQAKSLTADTTVFNSGKIKIISEE